MGHVYVDVEVVGSKGVGRFRALVDAGATYTVIPRKVAEELGVATTGRRVRVATAKGEAFLDEGIAVIRLMGEERANVVLISDDVDRVLVGVTTLETFGLRVDPTTGQLERVGVLLLNLRQ
ncbi:retroviral-like aspartic protease family protein [Vulcanisaeta sp. JCM 14467]|uniref:retroviral-like aspartic protease family protein n=1 Tax=Vulcanisaeta sp. JCM 14467 TaxID=1295370 RepID=UPI0006D19341|nr:retroviral-like aspartic protease family protein [Vulcanisaeta sp. JCM 14467]